MLVRICTLTISLALPLAAFAQRGWTSEVAALSLPGQHGDDPRLAVDAAGNGLTVWEAGVPDRIEVARFTSASRTWAAPATISTPGPRPVAPQIAMNAGGDAVVIWLKIVSSQLILQSVRFESSTGTWTTPIDLSATASAVEHQVALSGNGDAFVVWTRFDNGAESLWFNRYSAASGQWMGEQPLSLPGQTAYRASLAADANGNAVAVWTWFNGSRELVLAARFSASAGSWSAPTPLSAAAVFAGFTRVAADGLGNAVALWIRSGIVEGARYDASLDFWSAAAEVSIIDDHAMDIALAVDSAGNAMAVWMAVSGARAARYFVATDEWTAPVTVSGSGLVSDIAMAADADGNAIVTWYRSGSQDLRQAVRYVAATQAWSAATDLATVFVSDPQVAFDGMGNATVSWLRLGFDVQATRWEATPAAPLIGVVGLGDGSLTIPFATAVTTESAFAPTNYEYSIDGGTTWIARSPASTASPLILTGLASGTNYTVGLRALNSAGASIATSIVASPGPAPGAPSSLMAIVAADNTVTLTWAPPPANSMTPTGYVIEGGVSPGAVLASIPVPDLTPTYTFAPPTGIFYLRVHTLAGSLRSAASNEIRIVINTPAPPSAPSNLLGLANVGTLTLSWTNTYGGGGPASLLLSVTGTTTATVPLALSDSFTYSIVPFGSTLTFSLAAVNASGVSSSSNSVTLSFPAGCTGVPHAPLNLVVQKRGSLIQLLWRPPATGPAVTGYQVLVGGAFVGTFPTTATTVSGVAGPGTYTLRVAATNACGAGVETPAQMVTIP